MTRNPVTWMVLLALSACDGLGSDRGFSQERIGARMISRGEIDVVRADLPAGAWAEIPFDGELLLNVASGSPETYVAYHPNQPKETFHRLVDGCRRLRGVTAVNMVQVINGLTAHEVVAMVELAASVGARVSFKVGDLPKGTQHFALTAAQKAGLLDEGLPAARKKAKHLGVRHNLDAFERQLRGVKEEQPPCFAGYLYSRIAVDGRVFFCCAHIDAGHVSEGPFAEVWKSPRYDAIRQTLHRGGSFAACQRCGKHDMNVAAERELEALLAEGALA